MKRLGTFFAFTLTIFVVGHARAEARSTTLTARMHEDAPARDSAFSLRFNRAVTAVDQEKGEFLYRAGKRWSEDLFTINVFWGDSGYILDLGEKSCKEIQTVGPDGKINNQYGELKYARPMEWIGRIYAPEHNSVKPKNIDFRSMVQKTESEVHANHCYLIVKNDDQGRVIALFETANHREGLSIEIQNVEVITPIANRNSTASH